MGKIRVLTVDEHPVTRKGIQRMARTDPAIQIIGEANNGEEAIRQAKSLQPDVVLMDLLTPPESGLQTIVELKRKFSPIKVIVFTMIEDINLVQAAIDVGADGYLLKDIANETILQAIQAAQNGEMPLHPRVARHLFEDTVNKDDPESSRPLTKREKEVLHLLVRGLNNQEVGRILDLAEGTVKVHVGNILDKLNVSTRIEAAIKAIRMGLISVSEEA